MAIPVQYSTLVSSLPTDPEARRAVQLILDAIEAQANTSSNGIVSLSGSTNTNATQIFISPNIICGLLAGPNCSLAVNTVTNTITIDTISNTAGLQEKLLQSLYNGASSIFDGDKTMYSVNGTNLIAVVGNNPLHNLEITTSVSNTLIPFGQPSNRLGTSANLYYTGADLFVNGVRVVANAQSNSVVNFSNYANSSAYANYSNYSGTSLYANITNSSNFSNFSNFANSSTYANHSEYSNVSNFTNTLNPDGNVLTTKFTELNISGNVNAGNITVDWGLSDAQVLVLANYRTGDPFFNNVINIHFTNAQTTTKMFRIVHSNTSANINVFINGVVPIFCPRANVEQAQTIISVYATNYGYFLTPIPYWA